MTDDASNSSESQARRRRRRRRRGGGRGEGPGEARQAGERPQEAAQRSGDKRTDDGSRKRERAARADGGRSARGDARSDARGEDRPRRRRRRRRRGDGEEQPGEQRGERASGAAGERAGAAGKAGSRSRGGRGRRRSVRAGQAEGMGEPSAAAGPALGDEPWATMEAFAAAPGYGRAQPDDFGEPAPGAGDAALAAEPDAGDAIGDVSSGAFPGAPTGAGDSAPDEDALPEVVELAPDLPAEPPDGDPDPLTWPLTLEEGEGENRPLDIPVRNVVGVKFSPAGRIYRCDAGEQSYQRGEQVVVETDRGVRIGIVAVDAVRKQHRQQDLKRILRRPNRSDQRLVERNQERSRSALSVVRDTARRMDLRVKIFRVEYAHSGKKALIYFTADDRVDFRELVRELSQALHCRIEMRQTGVRDEAKMVGGIGSCGRELCCTTWLPEFVPVSIKMAKDQGLVLNPTKVSGQCGRLKCCLVYEQATYAELRKGLPKLGKRVITEAGEGRVVEVDVLHQRVRVSLGPGELQVFEANQVKPMFPSQSQNAGGKK